MPLRLFLLQDVCAAFPDIAVSRPLLWCCLHIPSSAKMFAQAAISEQAQQQRVLTARRVLASTYDPSTGLFHGTGWWNSANGITVLVDASRDLETHEFDSILSGTFDQAQYKFPGFINEFYDDEGWWARLCCINRA